MNKNNVDKTTSEIAGYRIHSKPDDYFWNAYQALMQAEDQDSMQLCFGYYRNINSQEQFVFEHAWLKFNGTIIDPSLSIFGPSKIEDYIYIEFFSLSAEKAKCFYKYVCEMNLNRTSSSDKIFSFSLLGYLQYDNQYDEFSKGMDIIAAEHYVCINRSSMMSLWWYNDMNGPMNELTFEQMLINKTSHETI